MIDFEVFRSSVFTSGIKGVFRNTQSVLLNSPNMNRIVAFLSVIIIAFGCTNLDERHVFEYKIDGTAEYVDDMHTIMGPGLDWRANEQVTLPVHIEHEIFGSELDYKFEVESADPTADVKISVIIDGNLIGIDSVFVPNGSTNTITIEGVFRD